MRKRVLSIVTLIVLMCAICSTSQAQKKQAFVADRVIAVVGDRMILQSDLLMAEAYMKEQYRIPFSEEFSEEEKAQILNQMMTQKLLAAQAQLDSLELPETRVLTAVQERIDQMISEAGSAPELEKQRNKPIYMLRMELADQLREQMLAQLMTQDVQGKVIVTPDEVKSIIKGISQDSLPLIPEQYEYSQIVIKAPSNDATRNAVKERLLEIRDRIMKGGNFAALATLYSDDSETAKKGGEMVDVTPQMVVAPFADAMVSLPIGGVSNIVETEFGFHIIQLISKNNGKYNVRHILMRSKFSLEDIEKAKVQLDSIRTAIEAKTITFAKAAEKYSHDEDTKFTGGVAVNSEEANATGNAKKKSIKFFVDDLKGDYEALSTLKEGEVSEPFQTYDNSGNLVCKIVTLNNRTPEHIANVKQDFAYLVDVAKSIKMQQAFEKWLITQKAKMYVRIEEPYNQFSIIKENWVK